MADSGTERHEERESKKRTDRQQAQLQQAQRLESLNGIAGGIAQDFNNLLAVILSYAAFVMAELAAPSGPDSPERLEAVRRDLEQITLAAEQAASLTCQPPAFVHPGMVHPRVLDLDHVVPWASSSPSSTTLNAGLEYPWDRVGGSNGPGQMAWAE